MFTKTQIKIMQIFVSKINERFSIKEISEILKKPYPLIHRSTTDLLKQNFISKDNKGFISLNYKENLMDLAYIESTRKNEFLKKYKTLFLFTKDVLENYQNPFFIFLIFGSSIEKKNFNDIDILFIVNDKENITETERFLENISSNFTMKFDINVISTKSSKEMLNKREKINVLNETLNNHVLIFGAENYYNLLKNDR